MSSNVNPLFFKNDCHPDMWGSVVHIRMAVTHPYTNSSQIASDYYFNQ